MGKGLLSRTLWVVSKVKKVLLEFLLALSELQKAEFVANFLEACIGIRARRVDVFHGFVSSNKGLSFCRKKK